MKQTDIAQKQQQQREEWQRNGIGGLVKSVDPAAGVVVVTTGAGPTAKTVTVHITKTTVLKRYAANSIRFADAQPGPLDAIHAGDQFQVLGQKNADGTEITAAEVVSGQLQKYFGHGGFDRSHCFDFDGEGPGHEEERHSAHYAGCRDAPPARHDGEDDCGALERRSRRRRVGPDGCARPRVAERQERTGGSGTEWWGRSRTGAP